MNEIKIENMNVNFEFLDEDAIENMITCLNYKMDKVVFLGFAETIQAKKKGIEKFLKKHCGVKAVEFDAISHTNLNAITDMIRREIQQEYKNNNKCFFDITGGEGLAMLAFGMLADELNVPMHLYDVKKNELYEYGADTSMYMSQNVEKNHVPWNLDTYVEMHGGTIDDKRGKVHKVKHTKEDLADIEALWELCTKYRNEWNCFCGIMAKLNKASSGLTYSGSTADFEEIVKSQPGFTKKKADAVPLFEKMIADCDTKGFFTDNLSTPRGRIITYKNEFIMSCLGESGSALEQRVYLLEKEKEGVIDCRTGVHIDWDGEIIGTPGDDVLNEIDVVVLKGYIPTFISCKAGKVSRLKQDVLYELDTVTSRFGGKYANKELAIMDEWTVGHNNRAKEMEIKVRVVE